MLFSLTLHVFSNFLWLLLSANVLSYMHICYTQYFIKYTTYCILRFFFLSSQWFQGRKAFETGWTAVILSPTRFHERPFVKPAEGVAVRFRPQLPTAFPKRGEESGRKRKTKQQRPGGQETNRAVNLMGTGKEWPVRHCEAFRPQPRFYCVHSAHPETQITNVDSEFYWQCFKDRNKRSVWSPETQKHLDAWPSKSVTRMAETQRLSCLCGSSPHTNHSLRLHSSAHIVVLSRHGTGDPHEKLSRV